MPATQRDRFRLDGRTALVTGANAGIGQAIAVALAEAGAEVVCAARSPADATLEQIASAGGRARAFELPLDDPLAAAGTLGLAGALDILVNNAGIIRRADGVDVPEGDWDAVMDVDLKAVFFLSQAFARAVFARRAGGAIVNVASVLAFQGGIRVSAYAAAKHGVAGLTRALACEWAPRGINVNAIAPGYVATANTAALRADAARHQAILDRIPAGRWGEPDDIAGAAVFLASPAARYLHGAVIPVDGGWLAR
jgi:2-dehydro-3-deoxy-D-gluconate 5-dehydrogenase